MAPSSCRYSYDPLDRLASASPVGEAPIARFYQKSRLATEVQGALLRTVFQHDDQLLAQQQRSDGNSETSLLVTDQQRSLLKRTDTVESESLAYTAYGHLPADSGLNALLGFSGERRDVVTGHYLLGNGYRAFNPVLMRFNSPDSLSPFGEGGLNAYAYCQGDPVNYRDPTGYIKLSIFMSRRRAVRTSYKPYSSRPSRNVRASTDTQTTLSQVSGQAGSSSGSVGSLLGSGEKNPRGENGVIAAASTSSFPTGNGSSVQVGSGILNQQSRRQIRNELEAYMGMNIEEKNYSPAMNFELKRKQLHTVISHSRMLKEHYEGAISSGLYPKYISSYNYQRGYYAKVETHWTGLAQDYLASFTSTAARVRAPR
jgi:RHS repeat-associated protein